ncbi:hypothetical protein N9O56_00860 [Rickettsiales bacterium]|nr:hypothetical protein [Rickettsiales bacterium]
MAKDISSKIVFAIECGINKHLGRSIIYSPLRFFYNRFKKNNPQTIQNVRHRVANDIRTMIFGMQNVESEMFIQYGELNDTGRKLLQRNYNIGINILKKQLTVRSAFRIISNVQFRSVLYDKILLLIKSSLAEFAVKAIESGDFEEIEE